MAISHLCCHSNTPYTAELLKISYSHARTKTRRLRGHRKSLLLAMFYLLFVDLVFFLFPPFLRYLDAINITSLRKFAKLIACIRCHFKMSTGWWVAGRCAAAAAAAAARRCLFLFRVKWKFNEIKLFSLKRAKCCVLHDERRHCRYRCWLTNERTHALLVNVASRQGNQVTDHAI